MVRLSPTAAQPTYGSSTSALQASGVSLDASIESAASGADVSKAADVSKVKVASAQGATPEAQAADIEQSVEKSVEGPSVEISREGAPSSLGTGPEAPPNELRAVVLLIVSVVQAVVEALVDFVLLLLLALPLLVPWRAAAVLETLRTRRGPDWRKDFRRNAFVHIGAAFVDIALVPATIIALLVPSRFWPIVEAFLYRNDMEDRDDDILSSTLRDIRWNKPLRVHFLAQFTAGIMDLVCLVPFVLVVVTPWRCYDFFTGLRVIMSDVMPVEDAYKPDNFDPANGKSRWMVTLEEARQLLLYHAIGVIIDIPTYSMGLASMFVPSRSYPLLVEALRLRGLPRKYTYGTELQKSMLVFDWPALQQLCALNFFYGLLDVFVFPLMIVVMTTIIRAVSLASALRRDWMNSPCIIKVSIPRQARGGGRASHLRLSRQPTDGLMGSAALGTEDGQASSTFMRVSRSLQTLAATGAGVAPPPEAAPPASGPGAEPATPAAAAAAGGSDRGEAIGPRSSVSSANSAASLGSADTTFASAAGTASRVTVARSFSSASAAPDFPLAEEFNGSYQLWGTYRGGPYYRLMVHNLFQDAALDSSAAIQPAARPAFIGLWDGMWHFCLTQDPSTEVIRFPAKDHVRDPTQAMLASKGENGFVWQRRRRVVAELEGTPAGPEACAAAPAGAAPQACAVAQGQRPPSQSGSDAEEEEDEEWVTDTTETPIVLLSVRFKDKATKNLMAFGLRKYNFGLRVHILWNMLLLLADVFLLPFYLLILLTCYRFPAIVYMMHKDAETKLGYDLGFAREVDTSKLSQTWAGDLGTTFGMNSRFEVLRQVIMMIFDALTSPALLILCLTWYRLKFLKDQFTYFSVRWHFHILLQLNVALLDLMLALPCLIVLITMYRFRYVLAARQEPPWIVSHIDMRVRFEILRQCGFVFLDLFTTPPLLLTWVTVYRRKYLMGIFNPKDTTFHQVAWLSGATIIHDLVLVVFVIGFCLLTPCRLFMVYRAMTEELPHWFGRSEDPQWRAREDIYRQVLLAFFDIMTAPALFVVYVTRYRWSYVSRHVPTSFSLRVFHAYDEDAGPNLHIHAWSQFSIVLHDVFLLSPACAILLLTYYRSAPVFAFIRSVRESWSEDEEEEGVQAPEGALTIRAMQEERAETRSMSNDGEEPGTARQTHEDQSIESHVTAGTNATNRSEGTLDSQPHRNRQQEGLRPARWRRITDELMNADPAWAEMVNWNEAPLPQDGPSMRKEIWFELLGLVCDVPFLIMGFGVGISFWRFPTLVQRFRERPRVNDRRRMTAWQLALTIRDILVLPFFLMVMLTPRAPRVLSQLFCGGSSKNPLLDEPAIEVTSVEGTIPAVGQASFTLRGRLRTPLGFLRRTSLHIQVVGDIFWQDVSRAKGRAKTAMLRMFLPAKVGENTTNAFEAISHAEARLDPSGEGEEVSITVTLPWQVKRADVARALANLHLENWVLVQLEVQDALGQGKVVASSPLQLGVFVAAASEGSTVVDDERLGTPERREQCLESQHRQSSPEIFAGLVIVELFESFVDLLHVFAFLFAFLAPWRFVSLISRLHEPRERWPCRVSSEALDDMADLNSTLRVLRGELLPLVNSIAKEPDLVKDWCEGQGVPSQVEAYKSDALREHRWLERLLRSKLGHLPSEMAEKIATWLEMQDARFYYTTLRSYTNCLLSAGRMTIEEHGVVIGAAREAEASFAQATTKLGEDIAETVRDMWSQALMNDESKSRGIWNKDVKTIRVITQRTASAALEDLGCMLTVLTLVLTLYRLPRFILDLRAAGMPRLTSERFKAVAARNLRGCLMDFWNFIQIVVLWVLLLITLMRFAEALSEALAVRHTLQSMRDMQVRQLKEGVKELIEILTCKALVRFGKTLVRCLLQLLLVPPACLNELMTRLIGLRVKLVMRFSCCVLIFYVISFVPLILRTANLPAMAVRTSFVLLLSMLLVCNVLSVAKSRSFTILPEDGWASPTLSVTWKNAITVLSIVVQPTTLILLLVSRHSTAAPLATDCSAARDVSIASATLTWLWLLLVSWIFLTQSGSKSSRNDAVDLLQLVLSHLLFLPMVVGLLGLGIGDCQAAPGSDELPELEAFLLPMLGVYLVTTQMLSGASGTEHLGTGSDSPDARYTTLYIMVIQLADFVAVAVPMGLGSKELEFAMVLIAYIGSAAWTLAYERLFGSPACCVRHLEIVRVGASLAPPWVVLCLILESSVGQEAFGVLVAAGLALLAVGTCLAACRVRLLAKDRRAKILAKSGLKGVVEHFIFSQLVQLCVAQSSRDGWSEACYRDRWQELLKGDLSPKALAFQLIAFQESMLAERMSEAFLRNRQHWLRRARRANTITKVVSLAKRLQEGVRLPSSLPQLSRFAKQMLGRTDLVSGFLDQLVGHKKLKKLLAGALLTTPSTSFVWRPGLPQPVGVTNLRNRSRGCCSCCARTRLAGMLKLRAGGVNIAAHCVHARVALEDVMWFFVGNERAKPPEEEPKPAKSTSETEVASPAAETPKPPAPKSFKPKVFLTWSFLTRNEGHVFEPSGAVLPSEPAEVFKLGRYEDEHEIPLEPPARSPNVKVSMVPSVQLRMLRL